MCLTNLQPRATILNVLKSACQMWTILPTAVLTYVLCVVGDVFEIGVSPVVYSASDVAGNRAECDFNVFLRSKYNLLISILDAT